MATDKQTPRSANESGKASAEDPARTAKPAAEGNGARPAAAAEEAAAAGRETVRAAAETMRQASATAGERAGNLAEETSQRFGQFFNVSARASEDMTRRTQRNADVMLQCGAVLGDGFQAILREWAGYAQGAVQRNIGGLNAMMQVRSMQDLIAVQAERMREEMELLLDTGARVSELSAKASHDAFHRLQIQEDPQRRGRDS